MSSLLHMFFNDSSSSSSDDDDDFEMVAILLTSIAMNKEAKHGGSVPRCKVVRRKLFDDYSTDDESMVCAFSSTTASSAAAKKKPLRRLATTARLARRPGTCGLVRHAGCKIGMPVMDLSVGEAPMTRRQKRKNWMQAKLKVKEVQAARNSVEKEAGTEDGLDLAVSATRREAKPNPKYLGPKWVH